MMMIHLATFLVPILLIGSHFPKLIRTERSSVSFCDGPNHFLVNGEDCPGGLNFGTRKPTCVCISGIYRSWTEDCGLYDGFTHKYCSPLWEDGDNDDDSYNVQGLRLLSGISNIYRDTVAVFGENGTDFRSWKAVGLNANGRTWSDTFYTLNGFPVVLMKPDKHDKFICVEPAEKKEKQVCRYFAKDNVGLWEEGEGVRILVMENCAVEGYTMAELKEHRCYDIMNGNLSECHLSCENGRTAHVPASLSAREKKSVTIDADDDTGSEGESMVLTSGSDGPGQGQGDLQPSSQVGVNSNNANFFQHRKLNKFTRLRQTGRLAEQDLSHVAPNRTFLLLDICKRIVRSFCPRAFVSDLFLDQAVELFAVLHRGRDFQYIEDIPPRDFQWIQDILLKCRAERSRRVKNEAFWGQNKEPGCTDGYIDRYEVLHRKDNIVYQFNTRRGSDHHSGKYHFVIDAVWLIIDLIHVLCYSSFEKSYRMYHVWEQASEKLFTRDIRDLWLNPEVVLTVYNSLLSNRALVDMVNLDRCAEAAYKAYSRMPELARLDAPRSHLKRRRKRAAYANNERISIAKSVDVFCAKEDEDAEYNC